MRPRRFGALALLFSLLFAGPVRSQDREPSVDDLRGLVHELLALRSTARDEENRWRERRVHLETTLALYEEERNTLDDRRSALDERREIAEAETRLAARREKIRDARIALDRRVTEVEADIRRLRAEWADRSRREDEERSERAEQAGRAERIDDAVANCRLHVREVRRNLVAQLSLVDSHEHATELAGLDRRLESAKDPKALPAAAAAVLSFLADHLEAAARIRRSDGTAVAPDGRSVDGTFLQIGDVISLFAADGPDGDAGIVTLQHGSPLPHLFTDLGGGGRDAISRAVGGEEAVVPLDVTGGAALKTRKALPTIVEQFRAGGVVMYPILGIAVIGLGIGIVKLVRLSLVRVDFDAQVERVAGLLTGGTAGDAEEFAREARRPLRRVLVADLEHRTAPRPELEEILNEAVMAEVPPLERRLSVLAVGAAVAPLLGLLGTVTGMIHTFRLISVFGTGDPRLLSAGISEALLTTEAGLVVAIPLLLLHAFLSRKVHRITEGLDTSAVSLLNRLKAGGAPA